MLTSGHVISVLRYQAWERAKGELNAMLQTYLAGVNGTTPEESSEEFEAVSAKVKAFVDDFEDHHC